MIDVRYALTDDHRETLADLYAKTWFGSDWGGDTLAGLLAGTDELVALCLGGDLVAFAHALTDYTTVAFVRDVVVVQPHCGEGLGRRLLAELRAHPDLQRVERFAVTCPDRLAGFYEACGFERRTDGAVLVSE